MNKIFSQSQSRLFTDKPNTEILNNVVAKVEKLNLKQLQFLLNDLNNKGYRYPLYGNYHRSLIETINTLILERTVLV